MTLQRLLSVMAFPALTNGKPQWQKVESLESDQPQRRPPNWIPKPTPKLQDGKEGKDYQFSFPGS